MSPIYLIFSKLLWLWIIGTGAFAAGLLHVVAAASQPRPQFENSFGPQDRLAPASMDEADEGKFQSFGRKRPGNGPDRPVRQTARNPVDQLMEDVRRAIADRDLDHAIGLAREAITSSGDAPLIEAADIAQPVDIDWAEVTAAALEADVLLKAAGEVGCRKLVLRLGAFVDNRLSVVMESYGPRPVRASPTSLWRGTRVSMKSGASLDLELSVLRPLAEIERQSATSTDREEWERLSLAPRLAGLLIVLRFLNAVRSAATAGLPFPVQLLAKVQSAGGEAALEQLKPVLELIVPCPVAPVSPAVADRLADRRQRRAAQWEAECAVTLHRFRSEYERTGYVHSRFIPPSSADYERFRRLETELAVHEPANRVSPEEFEAVFLRVAQALKTEMPHPVDLKNYAV